MDPASVSAIGAILGVLYQYGPWGVAVVVLYLVIRVWRTGEFLPKSVHDTIVAATTQRYLDLLDRFTQAQEAIKLWREQAERAAKAAEASQSQHADILGRLDGVRREVEELRDDLRDRDRDRAGDGGRPDATRSPGRRPAPREGG